MRGVLRAAALALCGTGLLAWPLRPALAVDDITVHVILPITGPEAFLGKQGKTALDIAQKLVNARGGVPVQIVYHDDQSKPEVVVQLLSQFAADHVNVILGPMGGGACRSLAPLLANGPIDYCFSPTMHATPGSFVFMTGIDTYDLDRALLKYAHQRGWKRIGLITSTDATGNDAVYAFDGMMKEAPNKDLSLVEQANFNPADISVTAQLARIKAARPDVLFAWTTGLGMGTILRAVSQVGLNVPVVTSWGNMTYAQMNSWAGVMPHDVYFTTAPWPASPNAGVDAHQAAALREMDRAFEAAAEKPDAGADVVWDPFMITVDVLRKLGPGATADQIRSALQHLKGYTGINGTYDFAQYPQRGVGESNAVLTRWSPENGTWEIVTKPSAAKSGKR
jgi:branched-chain amino acid transport system substrate-binding protein